MGVATSSAGLPAPSGVRLLADRLETDLHELGVPATVTVEHLGGIRWQIVSASDRVTMRIVVDSHSRGRLMQRGSSLRIDGTEVERSKGYEDLLRIYLDPDRRDQETDWPATEVPLDESPAPIQKAAASALRSPRLSMAGLTAKVLRAGPMWALILEGPRIRMQFTFSSRYEWLRPGDDPQLKMKTEAKLWVDGVDYSKSAQGALDKILAEAAAHMSAPKEPGVRRESAPAVNAGAQYHRTTVIRV